MFFDNFLDDRQTQAGAAVAATRALVRDLIAEMVGTLIAWGAAALASSWFTLRRLGGGFHRPGRRQSR